jgi:hypothetical protein
MHWNGGILRGSSYSTTTSDALGLDRFVVGVAVIIIRRVVGTRTRGSAMGAEDVPDDDLSVVKWGRGMSTKRTCTQAYTIISGLERRRPGVRC